jgi:hypothetical protein
VAAEDLAAGCHGGCCHNTTGAAGGAHRYDASRVALPAIAGAAGTIALAVVTVRLSIGNGNTRIGCASLIAVAGFHTTASAVASGAHHASG